MGPMTTIAPTMPPRARRAPLAGVAAVVMALIACLFTPATLAQDAEADQAQTDRAGSGDLLAAEAVGASDLELTIQSVGLGGAARIGDWFGVRVRVRDLGTASREVVIRLQFPDQDGDDAQMDRVITTTPGATGTYWVYARAPYWAGDVRSVTVSAYLAIPVDTEGPDDGRPRFGSRVGRVLARDTTPVTWVERWNPMMAVLGRRPMQLNQYAFAVAGAVQENAHLWHYTTSVAPGLRVENLPDRWQGLAAIDVLVWGDSGSEESDPQDLANAPDTVDAIREWVSRGGHLVIVWPSIGSAWSSRISNPLVDLLPAMQAPKRREGVDLRAYRDLLTGSAATSIPVDQIVHTFEPATDAGPGEAVPIIQGRDGETLVMRRIIGSGAVTVIGLDLRTERMSAFGLPEVETFWNRVLGRRGRFLSDSELTAEFGASGPTTIGNNRERLALDSDIAETIKREGESAAALLLAVLLFALYWVTAGPLGFALLKRNTIERHAWLGFVAAVGVFTAIAWSGASVLRPRKVDAEHVALVEQVHGQNLQRTRMWASVLIPRYGEAVIAVEDAPDPAAPAAATPTVSTSRSTHLLTPWEGFDANQNGASFPDNRGYRIEAVSPDRALIPVRQTVKQVQVDWAGPPNLGLPRPVGSVGDTAPPTITLVAPFSERPGDLRLAGRLTHDLPGPLRDVLILWISGQRDVAGDPRGALLARGGGVRLDASTPWLPQQVIDLASITQLDRDGKPSSQGAISLDNQMNSLINLGRPVGLGIGNTLPRGSLEDRLIAAMLMDNARPPNPDTTGIRSDANSVRVATHGWDAGRWFTQPCVIVIGVLDTTDAPAGPTPAPLTVAGRPVESRGRTIVRWVYPLPPSPPAWGDPPANAPGG